MQHIFYIIFTLYLLGGSNPTRANFLYGIEKP